MNWGWEDVVAAGILITALIGGVFVTIRLFRRPVLRMLGIGMVIFIIALIWADLAVGIFTDGAGKADAERIRAQIKTTCIYQITLLQNKKYAPP